MNLGQLEDVHGVLAGAADPVTALALEIADEAARTDIECKALPVMTTYEYPVYDVSGLEDAFIDEPEILASYRADIERAVRYLDVRGLLVRPIHGNANFVSFS